MYGKVSRSAKIRSVQLEGDHKQGYRMIVSVRIGDVHDVMMVFELDGLPSTVAAEASLIYDQMVRDRLIIPDDPNQ